MGSMRNLAIAVVAAIIVVGGGIYFIFSGGGAGDRERFKAMVDQTIAQAPQGVAVAYKSIDYAASRGTVKGITLHKADPDALDVTIDEIEFTKPNLDFSTAWAKAANDPKALTPDTAIPLFTGSSAKGVAIKSGIVNGSYASFNTEGARIYPWSLFQPGVGSWSDLQKFMKAPPVTPDFQAMLPLLKFSAAAGMALAVDSYTMESLQISAKAPPTPNSSPVEVSYEIHKIAGRGHDRGTFAEGGAEGISFKAGPMGSGTIERVSIAGYDLRKPMTQLLSATTVAPEMLDGLKIGKVEYSGLSMQYLGMPQPVVLARFAISNIAFSGYVPVSGGFALEGLRLTKAQMPDPNALEAFDKLGLETLTFSVGAGYQWDLAKKSIALRDIVLKVDELGSLNFAADVAEITPNMLGAMQAQLAHALLKYEDHSLVERAIKAAAADQHRDAASFRTMMVALVQDQAAHFADSPPLAAAAKALVEFIGAPHSLTIELSPPKPVAIMTLQGAVTTPPPQLATTLGLAVTANK
jgi:hypothetical protein